LYVHYKVQGEEKIDCVMVSANHCGKFSHN